MSDRRVKISIEGNSASYVSAARESAAATKQLASSVDKTSATMQRASATSTAHTRAADAASKSASRFGESIAGFGKATSKAGAALTIFNGITAATKGGTFDLGRVVSDVAFRFGPWGAAIGSVGHALINYLERIVDAEKGTGGFASRVQLATRALNDHARSIEATAILDQQYALSVRSVTEEYRQGIWTTEDAIAAAQGYGESTEDLSIKLLRLRSSALQAESGVRNYGETLDEFNKRAEDMLVKSAALERQADLMQITADAAASSRAATKVSVGRRSGGGQGRRGPDPTGENNADFAGSFLGPNARGSIAGSMEDDQFAAGLRESQFADRAQMERGGEREGSIESMRAELDMMTELEEIRANSATARREQHDEEMRQLQEKQAAYAAHASTVSATALSILSITDARRSAINAAKAQGKTDKQAAREGKIAAMEATASQLQQLRNMAIVKAIEQTALGIGALASFNYPSAGLHFAAAATWGVVAGGAAVGARQVGASASSMRARDSGSANTGGGYGGGGSTTAPRGGTMPGSDSPIPGSPGPNTPSSGTSGGKGTSTTVVQIGEVHTYGTPRREWIRDLDEAITVHRSGSRERRIG